ncbi:uncharacterized protein LOC131695000 [Topomyia yanbarensis]|uniref:uncharacterized protein LOC131695000 n=1 Tax=Topomyia yanbarensis TaxID=2498891 RepID=UPI00273AEB51|nr:uncharacterized protein LOC131695000 [Topomyia yanbarensis]
MDSSDEDYFATNSISDYIFGKKKKYGIHPINQDRRKYGEFYHLYPQLREHPDKFYNYLRMTIPTFDYILDIVDRKLMKMWTNFIKTPITPCEKLVITIRFLATGTSFAALSYSFRVGRSTIGDIVKETCRALWEELQPIHMPKPTQLLFRSIAQDYWELWNFPNCAGSIDGKHIRIQCPPHSGTMFYNYKKFFSIVLQGVADARCKFIAIEVGGYGKQSDGGTFNASNLFQLLRKGNLDLPPDRNLPGTNIVMPYVFLADEAYPLLQNLLRPYARRDCSTESEYYNTRLSRGRKCIECAFGSINAKWRILWKPIETDVELAEDIVKALCILHNMLIDKEGVERVIQEAENFQRNTQSNRTASCHHVNVKMGRQIRDEFRTFFWNNKLE